MRSSQSSRDCVKIDSGEMFISSPSLSPRSTAHSPLYSAMQSDVSKKTHKIHAIIRSFPCLCGHYTAFTLQCKVRGSSIDSSRPNGFRDTKTKGDGTPGAPATSSPCLQLRSNRESTVAGGRFPSLLAMSHIRDEGRNKLGQAG